MASGRSFERDDVLQIRRSPWLAALPFLGIVPLVAYLAASSRAVPEWIGLVLGLLAIVTPVFAVIFGMKKLGPQVERGRVHADATGVHWNGELRWPRHVIASGMLVPETPNGPVVRLANPSRLLSVDLAVGSVDEGRALLDVLDLGASKRTANFVAHARVHGVAAGAGLMFGAIFGAFAALRILMHGHTTVLAWILAAAINLLPYIPVVLAIAPTHVTVGVDGVLLRRLGRSRFIAYRDVERVESYDEGVRLVMRDGRVESLRVGPVESRVMPIRQEQIAQREALLARIREAMGSEDDGAVPVSARALDRGGRTATEWMAYLRSLARRHEGGMREAPVLRSQLWALLSDPKAEPMERAGAAVALAEQARDEAGAHERLRAVAVAVAEPKLRVVIEAAAAGADAKLARAIDQLVEEERLVPDEARETARADD